MLSEKSPSGESDENNKKKTPENCWKIPVLC